MRKAIIFLAAAFLLASCADGTGPEVKTNPQLINSDKSRILLVLQDVPPGRVRYFHVGWTENYSANRYAAVYRDRATGAYSQFTVSILAPDRVWGGSNQVTIDGLKQFRFFRNKTIVLGKATAGIKGYSDSSVAAPNYIIFQADGQHCVYGRRLSSVNQEKHNEDTYAISGFYCAPGGEGIGENRAFNIIAREVVFVPTEPGDSVTAKENWDIRRIVIQWDGRADALPGTVTFPRGKREGKILVTLPQGKGMCEGTFFMPRGGRGSWLMRCPDGIAADGWFKALGKGKGSVGEGTDTEGRSIKFTVLGT